MTEAKWARKAEKQLAKLSLKIKAQILAGVDSLVTSWPSASNVKALVNRPEYRLRVGEYRVFFVATDEGQVTILNILQVRKRDDQTYKH